MRFVLTALLTLLTVGCTDVTNSSDAGSPYGSACTQVAPISPCVARDGQGGWCISASDPKVGTCLEACNDHDCAFGGTQTPVFNDCYCAP